MLEQRIEVVDFWRTAGGTLRDTGAGSVGYLGGLGLIPGKDPKYKVEGITELDVWY